MKNIAFLTRPLTVPLLVAAIGAGALTGCTSTAVATRAAGDSAASAVSASGQPAITPRLKGADNFRDLGGIGAGYPTGNGTHVARGVVYRSNALALTGEDVAALSPLGITAVIDLRTTEEIADKKDVDIPGATWVNENVLGSLGRSATASFTTPAEADTLMTGVYEAMVTSAEARAVLGETLTAIADAEGAVVVHCTAGKDRTGWVSALLLHIAGVDEAYIDQNYLLSNQYSRASIASTLAHVRAANGDAAADAYAPLLGVQQSFLDAATSAAEKEYGSIDGYLTAGLGLSADTIATLRAKLTV